jgi:hypothetical protein
MMTPHGTLQLILYYVMVAFGGIGVTSLVGLFVAVIILHLTEPKQYRRPK